ncbi:nuclear speckle splicing regulatory protein 1 [Sabethes cyaneus]|uniref:nuclear speckle splicing regulatory protein 1 n=1 Tax=Sabethes cyaneus TaxID=53552 RepID=UPI00237DD25D|nr:nuclear speckle splicing regulatory protein 1 [Sabethes cyaneus]
MSKQYGLIDPKAVKASKQVLKKPVAFESDSDSDTSVPKPVIKAELGENQKRQVARAQEKALAEDPTIYQYDELYGEMDSKRKETKLNKSKEERKPKYIEKLLETAEKRKKEQERRIERQVQKEREAEGEMFKDKESFVTSAYRAKLEEMKEAEEQEKREEYLESIGDVTKQGDLGGFYRHIYSQKLGESSVKNKESQQNDDKKPNDSKDEKNKKKSESSCKPNNEGSSKSDKTKSIETLHSRQYRKRRSDDEENDVEKNDHSKKIHLPSNLDADSDFSIDSNSSSSSSETGSSSEGSDSEDEKNSDEKLDTRSPNNKKIPEDQSTNGMQEKIQDVKPSNGTDENMETHKNDAKEKKSKVDIWKKRTVGAVFDAALQRYYERKAARESG